jgi:signal transduction histidine kinase
VRSDPDGAATNIGCWGETIADVFPVGTRFVPDPAGDGVAAIVLRTGQSYRIDNYSAVVDPVARSALDRGIESAVGCPIVVRGAVWGAIFVTGAERFPPETELRLTQFADLVATAVANAEARWEIVQLAEEQAAQRRVATLVAYGAAPVEIFSAVTAEVGRLFATDLAVVGRLETAPPSLVAVAIGPSVEGVEVGSAWALDDPEAANEVFRSRRAVRADERLRQRSAALADTFERLGVASLVASPIIVDGRFWGAVIVPSRTELPADTEERLQKFTDLVGIAIANADGKSKLAASRRRIVTTSDETRRRIERNLHDGTQQRLVSLGLAVRAAEANVRPDRQDLRDELSRVARGLAEAVEDLQEISRGIHPAVLSKGGLGAALRSLAAVSPIAVDLEIETDARLAEAVEVAAYYVASEALANAAKHSDATRIDVSLEQRDGRIVLSIRDDGVGGADPARGSGLVGLTDRVEALGGSITVESRPGEGTEIEAQLPVELETSRPKP